METRRSAIGQIFSLSPWRSQMSLRELTPTTLFFASKVANRVFSHDVTAAILVFQNNETAAMLVSQTNPVGVELFSYANTFFCSNEFA